MAEFGHPTHGTADHGASSGGAPPAAHGATAAGGSMHRHGTMDTSAHEKTFAAFTRLAMRAVVVIVAVLIFMALVNA